MGADRHTYRHNNFYIRSSLNFFVKRHQCFWKSLFWTVEELWPKKNKVFLLSTSRFYKILKLLLRLKAYWIKVNIPKNQTIWKCWYAGTVWTIWHFLPHLVLLATSGVPYCGNPGQTLRWAPVPLYMFNIYIFFLNHGMWVKFYRGQTTFTVALLFWPTTFRANIGRGIFRWYSGCPPIWSASPT